MDQFHTTLEGYPNVLLLQRGPLGSLHTGYTNKRTRIYQWDKLSSVYKWETLSCIYQSGSFYRRTICREILSPPSYLTSFIFIKSSSDGQANLYCWDQWVIFLDICRCKLFVGRLIVCTEHSIPWSGVHRRGSNSFVAQLWVVILNLSSPLFRIQNAAPHVKIIYIILSISL